jgi:hypothetical protein
MCSPVRHRIENEDRKHAAMQTALRMSDFPGCATESAYRKIGLTN